MACIPLVSVPEGAQIECLTDADCPAGQGFVCRTQLGRCVSASDSSLAAPAASDVELPLEPIGRDGELVVSFTVSRALLEPPVVELAPAGGDRTRVRLEGAAGLRYTFRLDAAEVGTGGAQPVLATLVDTFGNTAADVSLGSVAFDFTAPVVSEIAADRTSVSPSDPVVQVTFRVSEVLGQDPVVRLSTGGTLTNAHVMEPLVYAFVYEASGDEDDSAPVDVTVEAIDEAGNPATASALALFRFDQTPPTLLGTASIPRTVVRAGQVAGVELTVSEALFAPPTVTLLRDGEGTALPLSLGSSLGNSYSFIREIDALDADGTYQVWLADFEDEARNSGEAVLLGSLRVDNERPGVLPGSTVTPGFARAGSVVTATFTVSEPLAELPSVRIGDVDLSCVSGDGLAFACEHTVAEANGAGTQGVVVELADEAGNIHVETLAYVELDFTPPAVASATVSYVPSLENPLGAPSRAAVDTQIRVYVTAAEPLDPTFEPSLTATLEDGSTIVFGVTSYDETGAVFWGAPGAVPDGDYAPAITWRDRASNETTTAAFSVPTISVKTSLPTLVVVQEQVTFVRSPWGADTQEDLGGFVVPSGPTFALAPGDSLSPLPSLPGDTFALDGGAPTMVILTADAEGAVVMGTLRPDGDTWPRLSLLGLNTPRLYATGVDDAGNRSLPVLVENNEWVATPRSPAFGTSPHQKFWLSSAVPSLSAPPSQVRDIDDALGGVDASSVIAPAEPQWELRQHGDGVLPPWRFLHSMAFDTARGRVIMGTGSGVLSANLGDMWEFDGSRWRDATPVTGEQLPPRYGTQMAYDAARGVTLVYGGDVGGDDSVWEWDGTSWTVFERLGAPGPFPTGLVRLFYDPARGVSTLLLYVATGLELWDWDGATWQVLAEATESPGRRLQPSAAFDDLRGRLFVFGGLGPEGTPTDTLWQWDGAAWSDVTPEYRPPPVSLSQMAYDAARDRVVLYGGDYQGFGFDEVWEWDGDAWEEVPTSGPTPGGRWSADLVYDPFAGGVLLFGGSPSDSPTKQSLWRWNGAEWSDPSPTLTPTPGARYGGAMVYDAIRQRSILISRTPSGAATDVWSYDGRWQELTPQSGDSPFPRRYAAIALDEANDVVLYHGGFRTGVGIDNALGDLWAFDGATFTELSPAGDVPHQRYGHSMAYLPAPMCGCVILYGGYHYDSDLNTETYFTDTWLWNGTTWTEHQQADGPPAAHRLRLEYFAARGTVVLWAGAEVWEFDGSVWSQVPLLSPPPPGRGSYASAYDPFSERLLVFGGEVASVVRDDAWAFDGERWEELTSESVGGPSPRSQMASTFDVSRGAFIMYGGNAGAVTDQVWEYRAPPSRQSAVQLNVSLLGEGIPVDGIRGLTARAHCGGSHAGSGAALLGWRTFGAPGVGGAWEPVDTNSAGVASAPPYLTSTTATELRFDADEATARQYLVERDMSLSFQCRPDGDSSAGEARVAADYMEVRVRYRNEP